MPGHSYPRVPGYTHRQLEIMADYLNKAIMEIGSQAELARILKIKSQAVHEWNLAPPNRCRQIERACGRKVTRYQLRPDVFGDGSDV